MRRRFASARTLRGRRAFAETHSAVFGNGESLTIGRYAAARSTMCSRMSNAFFMIDLCPRTSPTALSPVEDDELRKLRRLADISRYFGTQLFIVQDAPAAGRPSPATSGSAIMLGDDIATLARSTAMRTRCGGRSCHDRPQPNFAVASDEALVDLIASARIRLVVIAPALTKPVADALSRRLDDLGQLSVTVILDADPEVYRLGFGDEQALDAIRAASARNFSIFVNSPASGSVS